MGVNSLPKTVTRQRRDCDLNPGPSAPESSTLTTRLPSHRNKGNKRNKRGQLLLNAAGAVTSKTHQNRPITTTAIMATLP